MTNADQPDGPGANGAPNGHAPDVEREAGSPQPAGEPRAAEPAAATEKQETLEERAARFERERDDTHERMLRVAADYENYKKRTRRLEEDAAVRARETLLREILPVLDNMERALQAVERGGSIE